MSTPESALSSDRLSARVRLKRTLLVGAGLLSLVLGLLGAVLPGLPTTPFVLLAAACFAKASPRLHQWLVQHRWLGPMVRDWEAHHTLPLRIKWLASGMMALMVGVSAWQLAERPGVQVAVLIAGLIGCFVVWRIPTRS
ncbi:MAG: YbaN family protein [Aquabacterium sp.]|uniref:YbaN family protein n=1 Tax=Aquabacterium sp. TaxID=1872578 RepID=UPI002A36EB21|nr:YbaN family protein [Aquabacterium sp.]MDX9842940.1 YbaN family protein [Aquabacterium sp.]